VFHLHRPIQPRDLHAPGPSAPKTRPERGVAIDLSNEVVASRFGPKRHLLVWRMDLAPTPPTPAIVSTQQSAELMHRSSPRIARDGGERIIPGTALVHVVKDAHHLAVVVVGAGRSPAVPLPPSTLSGCLCRQRLLKGGD